MTWCASSPRSRSTPVSSPCCRVTVRGPHNGRIILQNQLSESQLMLWAEKKAHAGGRQTSTMTFCPLSPRMSPDSCSIGIESKGYGCIVKLSPYFACKRGSRVASDTQSIRPDGGVACIRSNCVPLHPASGETAEGPGTFERYCRKGAIPVPLDTCS